MKYFEDAEQAIQDEIDSVDDLIEAATDAKKKLESFMLADVRLDLLKAKHKISDARRRYEDILKHKAAWAAKAGKTVKPTTLDPAPKN